jgi:hypothetical protein
MVISGCRKNKKEFPGNYGSENKDHTGKKGMGIYFYSGEKNIFKNQQDEHPDAG